MRPRFPDLALGVLACLAVSAAVHRWSGDARWNAPIPSPAIAPTIAPTAIDRDSLEVATELILESAMFGRAAAPIMPLPQPVSAQAAPAAAASPPLTLKAIVGGPPWQAVLAGMPGEAETMVAIGSDVRGLRVLSITRDAVVLRDGDSTVTLTMRPIPR